MVVTELFFYELMFKYLTQLFNRKIMTKSGKILSFSWEICWKIRENLGEKNCLSFSNRENLLHISHSD